MVRKDVDERLPRWTGLVSGLEKKLGFTKSVAAVQARKFNTTTASA